MSYNRIIIEKKIKEFLEEDCSFADVSSNIISDNAQNKAKIYAKSSGYISGLEELKIMFKNLNISTRFLKKDGEKIKKGDILVELEGNTRNILLGERVGLNLVTHMSKITSTTRKYVNLVKKSGKNVKIAGTRKTLPGLRIFEKKAISLGGGDPHRFSLDDCILLKDTHLKFYEGNVKKLLAEVKEKASFSKKIEIEVETVEDVLIAAQNGADIIMFDNMDPNDVQNAINLLIENNLRERVIIEVSGNITVENLLDYVEKEPDIVSTSQLTLFPFEKVDLSLQFD